MEKGNLFTFFSKLEKWERKVLGFFPSLKLQRTFQTRGIENKGEEKSSDIRELVCFGIELRGVYL